MTEARNLLSQERFPEESFEAYKNRRAYANKIIKQHLRSAKIVHDVLKHGTINEGNNQRKKQYKQNVRKLSSIVVESAIKASR